jgi:hypothetical protein
MELHAADILKVTDTELATENVLKHITTLIENKTIELPRTLTEFVNRRLKTWIKNALLARDISENDFFIIDKKNDEEQNEQNVIPVDKDTGVEQLQTQWSEGLHQFLELKFSHKLTPESLKAVFMSNLTYFNRYRNKIYGLTGTIGTRAERDLLAKTYEVDFFNLPLFKDRNYLQEEAIFAPNKITGDSYNKITPLHRPEKYTEADVPWLEAILKDVQEKITGHRANLIICESIKEVDKVVEYLNFNLKISDKFRILRYDRSYRAFEVGKDEKDPIQIGDVIVATNLAGRGTDLNLSKDLEKDGLHVILSYLPYNRRIEEQAFGRTARKGIPGTGRFIIQANDTNTSIIQLQRQRDSKEEERLEKIRIENLQSIEIEEKLFAEFTAFHQSIKDKFVNMSLGFGLASSSTEKRYVELQLKALRNHWSLWLDSMSQQIKTVSVNGKDGLFKEFAKFKSDMMNCTSQAGMCKLSSLPSDLVELGLFFIENKYYDHAVTAFHQVIEKDPEFSEIAHYYSAVAIAKLKSDCYKTRCTIAEHLLKARKIINRRSCQLDNAKTMHNIIANRDAVAHQGKKSSQYDKQIENEQNILSVHRRAIDLVIGGTIYADNFVYVRGVDGNQALAEEIYKKLCKDEQLIINSHLSKNRIIRNVNGEDLLYLISDQEERLISFPQAMSKKHVKLFIKFIQDYSNPSFTIEDYVGLFIKKEDFLQTLSRSNYLAQILSPHTVIELIDKTVKELPWPSSLLVKQDAILNILLENQDKEFCEDLFIDLGLSDNEFKDLRNVLGPYLREEASRYAIVAPSNAPLPAELKQYEWLFKNLPKKSINGKIYIDINQIEFVDDPITDLMQVWLHLVGQGVIIEPKVSFADYRCDASKIEKRKDEMKERLKTYTYAHFESSLVAAENKQLFRLQNNKMHEIVLEKIPDFIKKEILALISKKVKQNSSFDDRKIVKNDIADFVITKDDLIKLLKKNQGIIIIKSRQVISMITHGPEDLSFKEKGLQDNRESITAILYENHDKPYDPSLFRKLNLSEKQEAMLLCQLNPMLEEQVLEFELSLRVDERYKVQLKSELEPYRSIIENLLGSTNKGLNTIVVKSENIKLPDDKKDEIERIWNLLVAKGIIIYHSPIEMRNLMH